jgi:hypothetical protein
MLGLISVAVKIGAFLTLYGFLFTKLIRPAEAQWVKTRLLPVTVALFAGGLILPSIWLYWALICLTIPFMSRSTNEAACLYVLTVLVTPTVVREMGLGSIYLLAFDKWLFAAIGLAFAVQIRRSRGKLPRGWWDLAFILLIALELIGARGQNFTSTLRTIFGISVALIFPYVVISRSLRRPEDVRRLIFTIVFAAFVLSCEAVYEWRMNFLPYELITQHLGAAMSISSYSKQRSGGLRASTAFPEPTSFGLFLAIAFLATLASRDAFKSRRSQMLALIVVLAGLYASNARSPIIALTLGVLAFDFYRRRYGQMMAKLAGLVALGLAALALASVSASFSDRLGLSGGGADTTNYRRLLFDRGSQEIAKHPLLGVSPEQATVALADIRQGEGIVDFVNSYIYYGLIAGVGGIVMMLIGFFGTAARMLSLRGRLRKVPGLMPIGGLVFSVALLTSVTAFTSGFGGRGSMIFYVLLAISSALGTRRVTQPASPAAAGSDARAVPAPA